jgi:hypothetical protein
MMNNNSSIPEILKDIETVMEATRGIVETMQVGERKKLKELTMDVSLLVARAPKEISGWVNHFAHSTDIAYVTRGKNGGIVRGTRPVKTIKPSKKAKVVVAADTVSE